MNEDSTANVLVLKNEIPTDKRLKMRVFSFSQSNTVMHGHSFAEIAVIVSGEGTHRTSRGENPLCRGDVLLVPYGAIHAYERVNELRLVNILFMPDHLPMFIELSQLPVCGPLFFIAGDGMSNEIEIRHMRLKTDDTGFVFMLLDVMIKEYECGLVGERCCLIGCFMMLMSRVARSGNAVLRPEKAMPENISRVISFMCAHFVKPLTLIDLVKISRMSPSSFMRVFARTMGCSPMNYLSRIRTSKACSLLQETGLSISDIAGQVGFDDSNYFSRTFRKHLGVTPRKFRREGKGG